MNTITMILTALLACVFLARALSKLFNTRRATAHLAGVRFKKTARWTLGIFELLGAIAAALSVTQPFFVFFVAVLLSLLSLLTSLTRRLRALSGGNAIALLTLAGSLSIGVLQPFGLKVLLLPKADTLAIDRAHSSQTIKTFAPGMWLESIQFDPAGRLFVSVNEGENYMTGDKSKVKARVLEIGPKGEERAVFTMPSGTTVGMITFDAQGHMFVNSQGKVRGIWKVSEQGEGHLLAELPAGSWPNGLTSGPDGNLYVADSSLGTIWRINPKTGEVKEAIRNSALRSRPWIALAPGANGVQFYGNTLYVTVSDSASILKFTLNKNGELSPPEVFARGIPGDDFAIDRQGNLFVTTHPFNTLVRVNQSGQRRIVADVTDHIVGATSAAFGKTPQDEKTLYVATDGGAFSGNPAARGTIVAVRLP